MDQKTLAANYSAMSRELSKQGNKSKAIEHAVMAMQAEQDNLRHVENFIAIIQDVNFKVFDQSFKNLIGFCLETSGIEHEGLLRPWLSILKLNPDFQALYTAAQQDYALFEEVMQRPASVEVLSDAYFLRGLQNLVVPDMEFEKFLTHTRRFLLEHMDYSQESFMNLAAFLSFYCFQTEFIFSFTPEEAKRVEELQSRIESFKIGSLFSVFVYACYRPLYTLKTLRVIRHKMLEERQFGAFVKTLIDDREYERNIRDKMPVFRPISDEISSRVREQYEAFSYPRWNSLSHFLSSESYDSFLPNNFVEVLRRPDAKFLIAGGGTGKQTLEYKLAFPQADIIAIDLSRASLAYAARKAVELGIFVDFKQGDILDADSFGEVFDFILCTGVLHHMRDPVEGWASLVRALKPGGLMRIALYSESARQFIARTREVIALKNYSPDSEGIRRFRSECKDFIPSDDLASIYNADDFYYLSECRDMLFHVQEHRMNLLQIREILNDLGLEFIKFEMDESNMSAYRSLYTNDPDGINLQSWHEFELQNPNLFINMYRFWVRKTA